MSDSAVAVPEVPEATTTPSPAATETPKPAETTPPPPPTDPGSLLGDKPKPDGEAKAEGEVKAEPFDPEKITFPEGFAQDDALFDEFKNIAVEHGLTGPAAQNLISLYAKQAQAAAQKQTAEWVKQNEDWQAEIKADKEIGGDKLDLSLQTFSKVANDPNMSDPKLREALAFTGAGNHPAVVRTLVKWASKLTEGTAVRGEPNVGSGRQPESLGQAIYGIDGPYVGGPKR